MLLQGNKKKIKAFHYITRVISNFELKKKKPPIYALKKEKKFSGQKKKHNSEYF